MRKHLQKIRKQKMEETGIKLSIEKRNKNVVLKQIKMLFETRTNNEEGD